MTPATRSKVSEAKSKFSDAGETIEKLLEVGDGGIRRIDSLLLLQTGSLFESEPRETQPKGTKRSYPDDSIEQDFKELDADVQTKKRARKAKAGGTVNGLASSSERVAHPPLEMRQSAPPQQQEEQQPQPEIIVSAPESSHHDASPQQQSVDDVRDRGSSTDVPSPRPTSSRRRRK